ncbi:MAG: RNA-binding protein [Alphaproteobacteria bacterium]|nr:RNA-binding protein [Alphaproteobacteria bacterium]MBL7099666.1 RNA-binding protein [Alphaproteobacteria bacterium]
MLRERRCIVSGETLPEDRLVRFVVSPDGEVVPDIGAILPGRGIWVEASAKALAAALKKNLFARAAKAQVKVAADIAANVERQLVARMQADLGMARRSGQLLLGFDTVTGEIKSQSAPALLIEASDGAADGKRKVFAAAHARGLKIETIECLTSRELGVAVGRENVIHAALKSGRLQERLRFDGKRLSGFRSVPSAAPESDE